MILHTRFLKDPNYYEVVAFWSNLVDWFVAPNLGRPKLEFGSSDEKFDVWPRPKIGKTTTLHIHHTLYISLTSTSSLPRVSVYFHVLWRT